MQRTNAVTTLISVLETQNLAAEVDTLLHAHAQQVVESLAKSFVLPSHGEMETNPVRLDSLSLDLSDYSK